MANSLNSLAGVLKAQGDYAAARPLLERSLAIRERALGPDHADVATSLNNLANLLFAQGDYAGAQPLYERSLVTKERALGADHRDVATALHNLATLLKTQGDYAAAQPLFERSLAIRERALGPDHPEVAQSLNNLAALVRARGDSAAARSLYERSLGIRERVLGPDHPDVASSLHGLANLLQTEGDHAAARPLYERSLAIRERALGPDHPDVVVSLNALAIVLRALGDEHAAGDASDRALAVAEARRGDVDALSAREALAFSATLRSAWLTWLLVHDRPQDDAVAWDTVLRWKGATTARLQARASAAALADDPVSGPLQQRLDNTRRTLAQLLFADLGDADPASRRAEIDALTRTREQQERALAAAIGHLGGLTAEPTGRDVCAALPAGAALIDLVRDRIDGAAHYTAFVVRAGDCSPHRVALGPATEIDARVARWRSLVQANALETRLDREGRALTATLWDPLVAYVGSASLVYVVPDGALASLPFGALPVRNAERVGARYLIEDRSIVYLDRAQDVLRPAQPSGYGALVVSAVDYGATLEPSEASGPEGLAQPPLLALRSAACADGQFDALPATLAEGTAVAASWARVRRLGPVVQLTAGQATEDGFVDAAHGAALVHVATNGFFATGRCKVADALQDGTVVRIDPMLLSGLVMAGANGDHDPLARQDGIFTAEEVATRLDLHGTQVVVLSACETGLGEATSGEGVLGLRRAFSVAGADQLVMSLWYVPDQDTAELMEAFYDELLAKRRIGSPPEAMRAAQLQLIARFRADRGTTGVASWAGFIVAGPVR